MTPFHYLRVDHSHAALTHQRHCDHWDLELRELAPHLPMPESTATLCSRGLLFRLLHEHAAVQHRNVVPVVCESGRVLLPGTPWYVSISHALPWTAVVIARIPVGIDIERRDRRPDWQAIAAGMLPQRLQQDLLATAPDKQCERFLEHWVRIEASAKINEGLSLPVAETDLTGIAQGFVTPELIGCLSFGRFPLSGSADTCARPLPVYKNSRHQGAAYEY